MWTSWGLGQVYLFLWSLDELFHSMCPDEWKLKRSSTVVLACVMTCHWPNSVDYTHLEAPLTI